jgi:hypothetical protein
MIARRSKMPSGRRISQKRDFRWLTIGLGMLASAIVLSVDITSSAQDENPPYPNDDVPPSAEPSYSDQAPVPAGTGDADDEGIIHRPPNQPPAAIKTFSQAETKKVCAKYQNKLISVYGEIYRLKNCTRHLVQNQDDIFKLSRQGLATVDVEATDVAAIPVGEPWEVVNTVERPCAFFSKKYVTYSYTDIYFVESCVRHLVPDYETFLAHSQKNGSRQGATLLSLTTNEFFKMSQGQDIPSMLDKEFAKHLAHYGNVDIIPIDEACKGAEGKIVTFYSRMYKIEKCHKREIDPESFTMHSSIGNTKLPELQSEQWVSMPDGKPYPDKKTK